MEQVVTFPSGQVRYFYESTYSKLWDIHNPADVILITDSQVARAHPYIFKDRKCIVINAGEGSKTMHTVEYITTQLLHLHATRSSVLVGIGGGVITDITGFVASLYMRGISFGFIPTTVLGMVDAAIGGKNGVNISLHKNITGTINQPDFILYDTTLLQTLPNQEWSNGFAEVIKYACLFDASLFYELATHNLAYYQQDNAAMQQLIIRCADWKNKIVAADEHEKGDRKLLNFGHTAAHAIENLYELPHGQAVAIGMVIAATLSLQITGLAPTATIQLKDMLQQYDLPISYSINIPEAMQLLQMDKKRHNNKIEFILLEEIGKATIRPLPFDVIEKTMATCAQ